MGLWAWIRGRHAPPDRGAVERADQRLQESDRRMEHIVESQQVQQDRLRMLQGQVEEHRLSRLESLRGDAEEQRRRLGGFEDR